MYSTTNWTTLNCKNVTVFKMSNRSDLVSDRDPDRQALVSDPTDPAKKEVNPTCAGSTKTIHY
jgi:hypothetical protein